MEPWYDPNKTWLGGFQTPFGELFENIFPQQPNLRSSGPDSSTAQSENPQKNSPFLEDTTEEESPSFAGEVSIFQGEISRWNTGDAGLRQGEILAGIVERQHHGGAGGAGETPEMP